MHCLPSGAEFSFAFLVYSLRCTFAPLNVQLRAEEFEFEYQDLPAKGVLVQHKDSLGEEAGKSTGIAIASARRAKIPIVMQLSPSTTTVGLFSIQKHAASKPLKGTLLEFPLDTVTQDHIALVLHTSGTTKKPKIVPITHRSIAIGSRCHGDANMMDETDVFINYMPMFHIAGLVENFLCSLLSGSRFVALPGMYMVNVLYDNLFKNPLPTCYSAVPVQHLSLLDWCAEMERADGKSPNTFRFIRNDSAALVPSLALRVEEYLECTVMPAYSMTESNPISSNPRLGTRKLKSVGPSVGPDLCIMAGWPNNTVMEPGKDGEVCVRGTCVMSGYEMRPHMDKDPNIETFTDGWMRSGDNGWLDVDGYLYLTGRFKELINRAGEKISPFEIEDAVRKNDAIQDVICFSAPHAILGETVAVAAVLKESKQLKIYELRQWLLAGNLLQDKWCPDLLVIMSELPKGPTGKPARINLAKKLNVAPLEGEPIDLDQTK